MAKTISAAQCRAARGLLNISQGKLAGMAGLDRASIALFEQERREPKSETYRAIIKALEKAGVRFVENGAAAGEGVRFAKPTA